MRQTQPAPPSSSQGWAYSDCRSDCLPDNLSILARSVAGCSNHNSVGETATRETLEKVISEALGKSSPNCSAVQAVCLAVSGVNHPADQQRILNWLRDIFPGHVKLFVQNDAVAALASGTMGRNLIRIVKYLVWAPLPGQASEGLQDPNEVACWG